MVLSDSASPFSSPSFGVQISHSLYGTGTEVVFSPILNAVSSSWSLLSILLLSEALSSASD